MKLLSLIRQLSRHLVGLWVTGHPTAMGLLRRILPSGMLMYLDSDAEVPTHEDDKINIRDNVKIAVVRIFIRLNILFV